MPNPVPTPDPVFFSYKGSPIAFALIPDAAGQPVTDLASYDQITFDVVSGTPELPGVLALPLRYRGAGPLYVTVQDVVVNGVTFPSVSVLVPSAASHDLPPGQYFAELWVTPPGGDPTFIGRALWNHQQTAFGV